ncbi:MAG TPA: hypothetical protein VF423_04975, partial [Actinomycetes bacterium]
VRLSDAASLGLPRHELLSPRWARLGRGVYGWSELDPLDARVRIEAVLLDLPSYAVIGGWASLWWQGARTLDGRTGPGGTTPVPILVHVGPTGHLRRRTGIDVDRSRLPASEVVETRGVRVSVATRAVVDVMCRDGPEEGLVAGDAACAAGLTSATHVVQLVERSPGIRGIPRARLVAPLLSARSRSVPESRFRFVWVVEAGLPVPLVNAPVVDSENGWLVGEVDLLDDGAGMAGEYDGAHHRELDQHTADNIREEGIDGLNITVVRATSIDLWPRRPQLVRRLAARRAQALGRDRSRDRWGVRPFWPR